MSDLIPFDRDHPPTDHQRIRVLEAGHRVLIEHLAGNIVNVTQTETTLQ